MARDAKVSADSWRGGTPSDAAVGPQLAGAARRLSYWYIFALSTVALLSIFAQWLVQRQLERGQGDSHVINLAGRQRMLSQQLAKAALRVTRPADAETSRQELRALTPQWRASHVALQHGDAELALPGNVSPEVAELFAAIEPHFVAMEEAAIRLLRQPAGVEESAAIDTILQQEQAFLAGMDRIVAQLEAEAEQRVVRLRSLERILLAVTLFVLLCEGLFIFRPAVNRIRRLVAELNSTNAELQVAKEEAERANSAKDRFLAHISHELRTPLSAILGMTELARDATDPAKLDQYLSVSTEAGEHLNNLLIDLIDVAKIDSSQLKLHVEPFDPWELTQQVARLMEAASLKKNLELSVEASSEAPLLLLGDRRRIAQVLLNLVTNAIKWTEAGSVVLRCEVTACGAPISTAQAARLCYTVTDNGPGIPPEEQARVFEAFTQLHDSTGRPKAGAGLGLAICRGLTEAMQGKLEFDPTPGVGARVKLTLTLPIATTVNVREPSVATPTADRKAVLVVEDTPVNQLLLRELLSQLGHDVTIAESGEEALDRYPKQAWDVVLIDQQLPGINGAETAARLIPIDEQLGRPTPPKVLVSAHPEAVGEEKAKDLFAATLVKPFQRDDLQRVLTVVGTKLVMSPEPENPPAVSSLEFDFELADLFLQAADPQRQALVNAVQKADWLAARLISHRLAGQVGYFAPAQLVSELKALETACLAKDASEAKRLVALVAPRLSLLSEQLAARLVAQLATSGAST